LSMRLCCYTVETMILGDAEFGKGSTVSTRGR
jgi:hypothetical protein